MNHVIDSIGKWGVKTTPLNFRMNDPKPGDPVHIGQYSHYPYLEREWAYIAGFDGDWVNLCIGQCSIFLRENGDVSISGGPFERVKRHELRPALGSIKNVLMWNWGDNFPGGGMGVEYIIGRPVFRLELDEVPLLKGARA